MLGTVSICTTSFRHQKVCAECFARIDEHGFCSKDDGASKTGLKVNSAISVELWLELNAIAGKDEDDESKTPFFSHRFANYTYTLNEECLPVTIDDLNGHEFDDGSDLLPIPTDLIPYAGDHPNPVPPSTPRYHRPLDEILRDFCHHHCCELGPDACLDMWWNRRVGSIESE